MVDYIILGFSIIALIFSIWGYQQQKKLQRDQKQRSDNKIDHMKRTELLERYVKENPGAKFYNEHGFEIKLGGDPDAQRPDNRST